MEGRPSPTPAPRPADPPRRSPANPSPASTTATAAPQPPAPNTPPPPSTPQPQIDPADANAVWQAVLDTVGQSNAAAWMDHFRLQSIDTSANPAVALIAPTMTFAGGAANVATGPRLQRVADTITQLLGRAVRAELAASPSRDVAGNAKQCDAPHSPASTPPSSGRGAQGGGGVDRRDALNLPLVRDVFEVFPDASLIDARKDSKRANPEDGE